MSDSVRPHQASPSLEFSRQEHCSGLPFPSPMHQSEKSEVVHSCLTLSDPMDCSLPGSSVRGIFQARVLEWVAIAFSNERLYVYVIILSCWSLTFKHIFKTLHLYSPSFKIISFDSLFCISLFCVSSNCSLWLETILLLLSYNLHTRFVCGWFPVFTVKPFIS